MWRLFTCQQCSISILKLHLCNLIFIGTIPIILTLTSNCVIQISAIPNTNRVQRKNNIPSLFTWDINSNKKQSIGRFSNRRSIPSNLYSVNKRQIAIIDGAEFISLSSSILYEQQQQQDANFLNEDLQDYWSAMPSKQAGFISFVTGKLDDNSNQRFLAVQTPDNEERNKNDDTYTIFEIDGGEKICVPTNTIVKIGKDISDADAISTAVAALTGVHYGKPDMKIINQDNERSINENDKGKVRESDIICFQAVEWDW